MCIVNYKIYKIIDVNFYKAEFKGSFMSKTNTNNYINTLPKVMRPMAKFVRHKEDASGLSTTRFIQDVSTCLIPKAVFSRSIADLTENTFLEASEETLIYLVPAFLGEKITRKIFSKNLPNDLKKDVATTGVNLLKEGDKAKNKKVLPVKAAIALAAMAIPLAEFSLNYIKNLMTLKVFKTGDFKNIASLEKNQESAEHQKKVKQSAQKHILTAAGIYSGCIGLATLLATKGKDSKILSKISEFIVAPGNKLFKKAEKPRNFVNKYFCMDFDSHNGKLCLSKGQLTTCVLVGATGYFGASADRGTENYKETATRIPIVGLYVITGSELVERGFTKLLHKMGKCKDLIGKDLSVPSIDELSQIAETNATRKKTNVKDEYKKLVQQKLLVAGLPFVFAILVMGFFVAGMTVHFTKKRYENAQKQKTLETVA